MPAATSTTRDCSAPCSTRRSRPRCRSAIVPRHLPAAARGPHRSCSAPARPRPRWPRRSRTTGRDRSRAWSSPATATPSPASAHRDRRGRAPGARRRRRATPPGASWSWRRAAGPDDLVLCLISGGGSALLALPAEGLTLADKQAVNRALLASGADIGQMNAVRKHLSAIKGGRLAAAAHPARVVTLLISDVPGDDPSVIASGPTVPDPSTFADARAILARYRIDAAAGRPRPPRERAADETPKPGDPRLAGTETRHDRHARRRPGGRGRGRAAKPARAAASWATRSRARRARSAGSWPGSRCRCASTASPCRPPACCSRAARPR